MEQKREDVLEEGAIEQETLVEKQPPMKWFKFIIYVQLIFSIIMLGIEGVEFVTGGVYGEKVENIYAYYGNGLKIFDVFIGVFYLIIAGFAIYTRIRLAKFKKNGPLCYLIFLGAQSVIDILYICGMVTITQQWHIFINADVIGAIMGTISGTICSTVINYTYLKKRRALFLN